MYFLWFQANKRKRFRRFLSYDVEDTNEKRETKESVFEDRVKDPSIFLSLVHN